MKYTGNRIIEDMLKKAQDAQDKGDIATAEHWLSRAGEVEAQLKSRSENES